MTKTEAMEILGVDTLARMARVMEWPIATLSQWEALAVAAKWALEAGNLARCLELIDRVEAPSS